MMHPEAVLHTFLIGIKIHLSDGRSHPIAGLLLIVIGLCNLCRPEEMWRLNTGWQFKDAEPSEEAILWCRIGGVIAIIVGFVVMF